MNKITIVYTLVGLLSALGGETRAEDGTAGADQFLFPGQYLMAKSCYYGLVMQSDGNLGAVLI
jgi:hypothetical protein